MGIDRRHLLGAAALSPSLAIPGTSVAQSVPADRAYMPGVEGRDYQPVMVLNGQKIAGKIVGNVKVFHLVLAPSQQNFAPELVVDVYGFNGRGAGSYIEAVEGDLVRIYVTNQLSAATSVHWHGLKLPFGMDGVGGLSQAPIEPSQTFIYEFPLRQHGTFMFHAHHDEMVQIAMGLTGLFIIHPRRATARVDHDFAFLLHEWKVRPGAHVPDVMEMNEFNLFTLNGAVFPHIEPMIVAENSKVRIRFANLGVQNHHPMHIHGHHFRLTQTDGGMVPESAQVPETTVLVPVGTSRTVEFIADYEGDWPLHCHMLHHMMNQMGHGSGPMLGVDAGEAGANFGVLAPDAMMMGQHGMADMAGHHMALPDGAMAMTPFSGPRGPFTMGGLVQLLKVRSSLAEYDGQSWYQNPHGTEARPATNDELARDGILLPNAQSDQ